TQKYEATIVFNKQGLNTLYVPINITNPVHTPTDGRIDIYCYTFLWDELPLIKDIAFYITLFIFASIVLIPIARYRFKKSE
ncbi:MAG: hypothetical protein ACTSX6_03935, partial [Candidatus Heimdallarchaeaceae archaeon]